MFGLISRYATVFKIGLFVVLVASLGTLGFLYKGALEDNAVKEQAIQQLSNRLGEIQTQVEHEQEKFKSLRSARDDIQTQYREVSAELQQYRGREDVVMDKPGLVQDKIQTSFDGFMEEIECATGDTQSCKP